MNRPRFLVAKYIPDLKKIEPRNVGVIVWFDGTVRGRFLGDEDGHLKAPKLFANSPFHDAYKTQLESWRLQFDKPTLPVKKGRAPVKRSTPAFLDALMLFGGTHFMLADGGVVADGCNAEEVDALSEYLYDELVAHNWSEPKAKSPLKSLCDQTFKTLKDRKDSKFKEHYKLTLPIGGEQEELIFSYAYAENYPVVLMQQVASNQPDNAFNAAMKFRCVSSDRGLITKDRCAALVSGEEGYEHRGLLREYSTIVNMSNPQEADQRLRAMGVPLGA